MTSWLTKQKKGDLIALADAAGYKDTDGKLKEELVEGLEAHLRANQTTLASKPQLEPFYHRTASPVKREPKAPKEPKEAVEKMVNGPEPTKSAARRKTAVKDEIEANAEKALSTARRVSSQTAEALTQRTPRTSELAQRIPLPASPAQVREMTEQQLSKASEFVQDTISSSGIQERLEWARENLSSVPGVEASVLLIEAFGLRSITLPMKKFLDTPFRIPYQSENLSVWLPDLFMLLTSDFWYPSLLWATISLLVPLVFAYFFNFTVHTKRSRQKPIDPLSFNIVKALGTWLVFNQGVRFNNYLTEETVLKVNLAVPGGSTGMLIGAGIGILTSVYEAVLKP